MDDQCRIRSDADDRLGELDASLGVHQRLVLAATTGHACRRSGRAAVQLRDEASVGNLMMPFGLDMPNGQRHIVALGAHADDIEIACGGTLMRLAESIPGLSAEFVIATSTPERLLEAHRSVELFLPDCDVKIRSGDLPDGRLPAHWAAVKELLEDAASGRCPDIVLAPSLGDAHQDHRTVAEIVTTVWRNHLVLRYEIPKWDGDIGQPFLYVPLSEKHMREKADRLRKAFPSQAGRDWFDDEAFYSLARLRGIECRARYAEAFTTAKGTLTW